MVTEIRTLIKKTCYFFVRSRVGGGGGGGGGAYSDTYRYFKFHIYALFVSARSAGKTVTQSTVL